MSSNVFYHLITLNRSRISESKYQICILLFSQAIRFLKLRIYVPNPQILSSDPPTKHVVRWNKRADLYDNTNTYIYMYLKLCHARTINFFEIFNVIVEKVLSFLDPFEQSTTFIKRAKRKKNEPT